MTTPKTARRFILTHEDYLRSAILGLAHLDAKHKPCSTDEAMYLGHLSALPKEKHISRQAMKTRNSSGKFTKIFQQARDVVKAGAMPTDLPKIGRPTKDAPRFKDHRMAHLRGLPTEADLNAQDEAEGVTGARWSREETAAIARQYMREVANGNKLHPARIVHAIQRDILPRDRWRKYSGIQQSHSGAGHLIPSLQAAFDWGSANVPGYLHPGPLPAVVAAPAQGPAQAQHEPETAPPVQVLEMVTRKYPGPATPNAFAQASAAFAATITGAVDQLLQAHAAHLMGDIDARLASIASNVGAAVAQQIETGLRSTVMATLAHELGGPVNPPPQQIDTAPPSPQEAPQAPAKQYGDNSPSTAPKKVVLRADVIGLTGNTVTEVKNALNGRADLNFIEPGKVTGWIPREKAEVFIATRFTPHTAERRCDVFHIKPHRVNGAASSMVLALEAAYRDLLPEGEAVTH